MTPEQQARARMLKLRNARHLEQGPALQAFAAAGLSAKPVADDRVERLLTRLGRSNPVKDLSEDRRWQRTVADFAVERFGLTIGMLWDWDGLGPLFRMAASSLISKVDYLATLYPSGFWLVDDNDRDALVVDLNTNEDAGPVVARLRELRLADA